MHYNVETKQEQDGNWVATVLSAPGLRVYGYSEEETLAVAQRVAALVGDEGHPKDGRILAFYPGTLPDSEKASGREALSRPD